MNTQLDELANDMIRQDESLQVVYPQIHALPESKRKKAANEAQAQLDSQNWADRARRRKEQK